MRTSLQDNGNNVWVRSQRQAAGVKDAKAAAPALLDGSYTKALRLVMARTGPRVTMLFRRKFLTLQFLAHKSCIL